MSLQYELKVISNKLPFAPEAMQKLASEVVYETAERIVNRAKILVPVDTGYLKSTIRVLPVNDLNAAVIVNAPYAALVEYGTRRQAAQPFLTPAIQSQRSNFEDDMAEVLNPENWELF